MIAVNWATKVISVPQDYLTPLGGSLYSLDINEFRLDLKDLEDDSPGMPWPDTHVHNTLVTVSGVTLARVVEIVNGYRVLFEDGQYSINLLGANSNILDVVNRNQVSIASQNSAGLIVHTDSSVGPPSCVVSVTIGPEPTATLRLMAWLVRSGAVVTSGLVGATIQLRDAAGSVVVASAAMTGPTLGVFRRDVTAVTLASSANYYAVVSITDASGTVSGYTATPTIA